VLSDQQVKDAAIHGSVFAITPDYVTPTSVQSTLNQIKTTGGTGPGGTGQCPTGVAIGTSLASVVAASGNKRLTPGQVTTVAGTDQPRYIVTVDNPGDIRVSRVEVRLIETDRTGAAPPPHKTVIPAIEPGQSEQVTITAATPQFGKPETIKVEVVPVHCETKKDNNSATYKVQYEVA
jgi:hypothetical protein